MQELNTVFPYGLNSRIDISDIHDAHLHVRNNQPKPIYKIYNEIRSNRSKKGLGINIH